MAIRQTSIYVLTVGSDPEELANFPCPDPIHSNAGEARIRSLLNAIGSCHFVYVGRGKRHKDAELLALDHWKPVMITTRSSPILGTADFRLPNGDVLLTDGTTVPSGQYTGSTLTPEESRLFLDGLPEHTLLCADREPIVVLGLTSSLKPGIHLHVLEAEGKGPLYARFVA